VIFPEVQIAKGLRPGNPEKGGGMKFRRRQDLIRGLGILVVFSVVFLGNSEGLQAQTAKKSTKSTHPAAVEAGRKNALLEAAISRCEDLTESAEAGKVTNMDQAIQALEGERAKVLGVLSPEAGKRFEAGLAALRQKRASEDFLGVALEAVETYRLLTTSLDREKLKAPIEVSLLDYAGFKVKVLTKRQPPDWQAMQGVATEAAKDWQAIQGKVADKSLRSVMNTTMAGLKQAIEGQDAAMARFAAQVVLDLVDLLEQQFKRQKR
jgi:hypothetical protein